MDIFPAIDIIDGGVVRLTKGNYADKTSYDISVFDAATEFKSAGATHLHIVDLDGAASGRAENAALISEVIEKTDMFAEVGGGIRTEAQIEAYLSCGAGRVILGTAAVLDPEFTARAVKMYGDKIAVGVDASGGKVAIGGWRNVTDIDAFAFCEALAGRGVRTVIFTDISRDGTLCGTNVAAYKRLVAIDGLKITASGGIVSVEELIELKRMGVSAAILGKALYERAIDLKQAIAAAEGDD